MQKLILSALSIPYVKMIATDFLLQIDSNFNYFLTKDVTCRRQLSSIFGIIWMTFDNYVNMTLLQANIHFGCFGLRMIQLEVVSSSFWRLSYEQRLQQECQMFSF